MNYVFLCLFEGLVFVWVDVLGAYIITVVYYCFNAAPFFLSNYL